ncbi:MAG: discoidin domain-containing protein [Pirellulaceae bacterium]
MRATRGTALGSVYSVIATVAFSLIGMGPHPAWAQSDMDPLAATASSEWGGGYGAEAAADGIANENGNYWQTVAKQDGGAWWQVDLGQNVPVRGIKVAWACYEDKYHAPPARLIIQLSNTGDGGSWRDVLTIEADKLPADEAPFDVDRSWDYPLPEAISGRFVRLLFPDGDQPQAKYDGYICLGEVHIDAPGLAPHLVSIEGAFGKVEVNVGRPSWARLYLRGAGEMGRESLLAVLGHRPWARGAYTYVVAQDGKRYESRLAKPEKIEVVSQQGHDVLQLTGVKLVSQIDGPPVATEDWTISAPGEGAELVWTITRRWQSACTTVCAGSPGLFLSFDARRRKNSTTRTLWYDPLRIAAGESALYALAPMPGRISDNHLQTIRDRDAWAIYKLWTNWNAPADLRLDVRGGHLYRRGSYAFLGEVGAVTGLGTRQSHAVGEVEKIVFKLGALEKQKTGYQLAIHLPDKETESALRDFYGSVFNGGAVNDQKGMDFGNESDGWYYAGSCWMYGATLAAGTPAAEPLSLHSYSAAQAFREHLAHVLSTLDEQGRAHFGYNQGGEWVDDNLHTIIGMHFYLLHTGDLDFVRQCLPALERMLTYFVQRRDADGLFKLEDVGAHWYYDAIVTSGVNGYYNAFFYKATCDLAEMEEAAGRAQQAHEYGVLGASIKTSFNRVFWKEDAPGGPRYLDWIDAQGNPISYFCDLCQWPPIAMGIASPEQARKIVATADARIVELEREHGYAGYAGLSALWPVPPHLNPHPWQTYGRYMNGGSLLCQTYWEIVARSRAGDAAGAARRLRQFAKRAAEIHWAGDNAADINGQMAHGDGEPYLADMVAATAAAMHGVMGIEPTWKKLTVTPSLPSDWSRAEADILYKGQRQHVVIENGTAYIEPLEQVLSVPLLWAMDFNLRKTAYASARTANVAFLGHYGDRIVLADGAVSGSYQSPAHDWGVLAGLEELTIAVELNGAQVSASIETSDDGFKTVASASSIAVLDGANSYALKDVQGSAVRLQFEMLRQTEATASPVIDGFRVTGSNALIRAARRDVRIQTP